MSEGTLYLAIILGGFIATFLTFYIQSRREMNAEALTPKHGLDIGLDPTTQDFPGTLLWVTPQNGFGWSRLDSGAPHEEPEVPKFFKMRLIRFTTFTVRGRKTGGIGKIEHEGHALDGYWVAFVPRWAGSWNFTTHIGPCNIIIGPKEPLGHTDVWQSISGCSPILAGLGEVSLEIRDKGE